MYNVVSTLALSFLIGSSSFLQVSSKAGNSVESCQIWQKLELILAFMVVLLTCKNEEDPIKNECAGVLTTFLPLKVYWDFFRRSRAVNSADRAEFLTYPRCYGCPCYLQE